MISYIARRKDRFLKLEKEEFKVPDEMREYLLYRDANLPERCRELVDMWTGGKWELEKMESSLKQLERPAPGSYQDGSSKTRLIGFMEEQDAQANVFYGSADGLAYDGEIFVEKSFHFSAELFDDEDICHCLQ